MAKKKAAKADKVTAARVDAFNAGKQDRMIRLIKDLQTQREALKEDLRRERDVTRRLTEAMSMELSLNPYFRELQSRHTTAMGQVNQMLISTKQLMYDTKDRHDLGIIVDWLNRIIEADQPSTSAP